MPNPIVYQDDFEQKRRREIIDGVITMMSPRPSVNHEYALILQSFFPTTCAANPASLSPTAWTCFWTRKTDLCRISWQCATRRRSILAASTARRIWWWRSSPPAQGGYDRGSLFDDLVIRLEDAFDRLK